jgi:hypothetical protein
VLTGLHVHEPQSGAKFRILGRVSEEKKMLRKVKGCVIFYLGTKTTYLGMKLTTRCKTFKKPTSEASFLKLFFGKFLLAKVGFSSVRALAVA